MNVGSLFSGIGGLDLGLERAGFTVRWQCEIDPYCRAVLAHHWSGVKCYEDIRDIDGSAERVDLIAGGFPCQPFSAPGRERGVADERWMWPEFARVIRLLRPRFVLVENVARLLNHTEAFSWVLADLHNLGFDAEWSIVSACSVGAPHRRKRLFLVAYSRSSGLQGIHEARGGVDLQSVAETLRRSWETEPSVARVANGIPRRVVLNPIRALGNAVVPQVAEAVGRMILAATV